MSMIPRMWVLIALVASVSMAMANSLQGQLKAKEGWVAYKVPIVAGQGVPCCTTQISGKHDAICDLDGKVTNFSTNSDMPESSGLLSVYWRFRGGKADQVRAYGASCPVTSVMPIEWIDHVASADSVERLVDWAQARFDNGKRDRGLALAALAYHADAQATVALDSLATKSDSELRKQAVFWLGQARGDEGAAIVYRLATSDPEPEVRSNAVFALSLSRSGDAYAQVRAIATQDADDNVRSRALFWMAQMKDPRAAADIGERLQQETSKEVLDQAVFALSRLDGEAGVDALIRLIEGNYAREIKRKALFWLGQSNSSRASDFLDRYLTR
jgi:hypothetical protein